MSEKTIKENIFYNKTPYKQQNFFDRKRSRNRFCKFANGSSTSKYNAIATLYEITAIAMNTTILLNGTKWKSATC